MYLEEVVLDGFKSYASRTTIGPFHPQFNAISGLNGTGKSNILDAICFVMGIKSLQQVGFCTCLPRTGSRLTDACYEVGRVNL